MARLLVEGPFGSIRDEADVPLTDEQTPVTLTVAHPQHPGAQVGAAAPGVLLACPTGQGVGLLLVNGSGTAVTATAPLPGLYLGRFDVADRQLAVPAGAAGVLPLPESVYGTAPVQVELDGSPAGLVVAVIFVS